MKNGMTVAELIEYLKTLNQDYVLKVRDSEYPDEFVTKKSITEDKESKTYIIY